MFCNDNGQWAADPDHTARLGRDWQLQGVRDAAYEALALVGPQRFHFRERSEQNDYKARPSAIPPFIQGPHDWPYCVLRTRAEHPRVRSCGAVPLQVTCGVATDAVAEVLEHIQTSLEVSGIKAKTIVSGTGASCRLALASTGNCLRHCLQHLSE